MTHPLLPVAVALALGILGAASPYFFLHRIECLLAATLAAVVAAVALGARRNRVAVAASLLAIFLGGAFYLRQQREVLPARSLETLVATHAADLDEPMRLTGWISQPCEPRELSEAFEMTLDSVGSERQTLPAEGRVRLYHYIRGDEKPLDLAYGERLSTLVRLRYVRGFWNDGDYDREARGHREGIMFQGTVKSQELVERQQGVRGHAITRVLLNLRHTLLERLDRLYPPDGPPDPTNAILRAMLLGDRSGLDRRTSEDFEKTGTFHALVIAGLHTAALGGFFFFALRLARIPALPATLIAIAGIACFAVISGMRVPVERAALMFATYLIARLLYRQRALLNAAAAAALALLVWRPDDLTDAGFQLSFYAVLLIGAISLPIIEMTSARLRNNERLDERLHAMHSKAPLAARALMHLYELAVTGCVIQIGFTLPMAAYFFRAGGVAVSANLLMVPLIGVVVPLGALTLGVSLISPVLAALPAVPLGWGVALMMVVARWHSGFTLAARRVPAPPPWLALAFLAAIFATALLLAKRWRVAAICSAIPVLTLAWLISTDPFPARIPHDRLEVTTLDVGQGDSILVVLPPGRTLLIDGGGLRDADFGTDTGLDAVAPYLWSRGIKRLDAIAMTHAHQDHIGGLFSILRNFEAGEVWIGVNPESDPLNQLKTLAEFHGAKVVEHHRGEALAWGASTLEFLSPAADYRPAKRPGNNDSLVMRVRYGEKSVLLAGDIERKMENQLVTEEVPVGASYLKIPHHGSKTSSTESFLGHVHAAYGVISVAVHSPFGHPNEEALGRLEAAGVHLLRTDRDGAVTWSTDGRRVFLRTFAEQARSGIAWGW